MGIKDELCKKYRTIRSSMNFQLRERESMAVCEVLQRLPEWIAAKNIMIYLSAREELDTIPLIKHLLKSSHKKLFVPLIDNKKEGILVSSLTDYAHLAEGMFHILEPRPQYRDIVDPLTLDLIIVPGIVFDRRGGRIGYGHGYYDRFLKHTKAAKIALAYEFQVLNEIPQHAKDVPMDIVVTASEIIRCYR